MKRIIFLSAFILLAPTLIYAQTIFPNRGGTGTTTIPTTGQVLVGQSNGTYAPQATATLGISGGSGGFGTTSIDTESELENILTDVTNVFTNNDGSLSDDDLSNNTTSDLLEGTNLYYTVGRVQTALTAGYNSIFGNSTTTNATTTNLAVTNSFNFLGTVITNVSTWFNGLFNTQFATKTTDNLTEGTTNKYNKISTSTTPTNGNLSYWTSANTLGSVATGTLTETATGLQFDNTRGLVGGSAILSLTTGYSIPLTTSTTDWQTAFGWGNHASQGYLSTTSGNWAGTFDGLEGTSYLARANHTGTQLASTISDFVSTVRTSISETITGIGYNNSTGVFTLDAGYSIPTTTDFTNWNTAFASTTAMTPTYTRGLFSNTATGLTYNSATGITALTAGYNIPLSASTTNWNTFYDTPSNRITAGTGLSWAGNTLNSIGGTGTVNSGTVGQIAYYAGSGTTISGTSTVLIATGTVAVGGATTNATLNVKVLPSSSQALQTQMTNTTDIAFSTYNTGDSFTRFSFLADGTMKWGSGAFVGDVGLNRTASGTLALMPYGSASTVYLGIGTTTPVGKLSVQGTSGGSILQLVSSAGTKFMEMLNTGVTTFLGTVDVSGSIFKQHTYASFTWPGPFATTTSATTTFELGKASTAESWSTADCYVTSGTGAIIFTDGTNQMNGTTTDSTGSTHTLSTNNTFTAKEKRFALIGPITNAKMVCTVDKIVNN